MVKTEEEVMKYDESSLAYALSLFEAKVQHERRKSGYNKD